LIKKLIRDNIPSLILESGRIPNVRILGDDEYYKELVKKLHEEVEEYLDSRMAEEIADIFEVLYALMEYEEYTKNHIEKIRLEKRKTNGSFTKRIYLESINGGHVQ